MVGRHAVGKMRLVRRVVLEAVLRGGRSIHVINRRLQLRRVHLGDGGVVQYVLLVLHRPVVLIVIL